MKARVIASPRPVPPNFRVVVSSAWLNRSKQPLQLVRRHADPSVGYLERDPVLIGFSGSCDVQRDAAVLGEFRGVAEQIEEALAQLHDVRVHTANIWRDLQRQAVVPLRDQRLDRGTGVSDQRSDVDVLGEHVHAVGFDLREIKHVIDQRQQMACVRLDLAEVPEEPRLTKILNLLFHHLAVPDHRGQGRAQLVAHVGEEHALGAVGGLGGIAGRLRAPARPRAVP